MACPNVPAHRLQRVNEFLLTVTIQPQHRTDQHFTSRTKALSHKLSHLADNKWTKAHETAALVTCVHFFSVCACVDLAGAPVICSAPHNLMCFSGLCSHSYCIYGRVSAPLTNHTHSCSLRLPSPRPCRHLFHTSLELTV